jgi:hypothetical protein
MATTGVHAVPYIPGRHAFDTDPAALMSDVHANGDASAAPAVRNVFSYESVTRAAAPRVPVQVVNPSMTAEMLDAVLAGNTDQLAALRPPGAPANVQPLEFQRLVNHQVRVAEHKRRFADTALYTFLTVLAFELGREVDTLIAPVGANWRPHEADPMNGIYVPGQAMSAEQTREWIAEPHVLGIADIAPTVRGMIESGIARVKQLCPRLANARPSAFWESQHMQQPFAHLLALINRNAMITSGRQPRLQVALAENASQLDQHLRVLQRYFVCDNNSPLRIRDTRLPRESPTFASGGPAAWAVGSGRFAGVARDANGVPMPAFR